jgi:hypothetical protein
VRKGAGKAGSDGHTSFDELRGKRSPERRTRNAVATKSRCRNIDIRDFTQATFAETMECGQDEISKLERPADVLVITFRRHVEAI